MSAYDDSIANTPQRAEAMRLVERKLSGQRLREAKAFILRSQRRARELQQLATRLEGLPDIDQAPGRHTRLKAFSDAEIERMRDDRAAGDGLQMIADRYGCSLASAWRYCDGVKPRKGAA